MLNKHMEEEEEERERDNNQKEMISGGLSGGPNNPPAFVRAEVERLMKGIGIDAPKEAEEFDDADDDDNEEELSDFEVDEYINDKEEIEYRRVIWEAMNKEFLEDQAAKKKKKKNEKAGEGEGMGKKKTTSKRRTKDDDDDDKGGGVAADTAAEADALSKKRLSSFINFDALEKLFGDDDDDDDDAGKNAKKARLDFSSLGASVEEKLLVGEEHVGDELADGDDDDNDEEEEEERLGGGDDDDDRYEDNDFVDGNADGENGGLHWYSEDGEEGYDDNNDDY